MQFLYHKLAGNLEILLNGEAYNYLFRVRRMRKAESLILRNLKDCNAYTYHITNLSKKDATLTLQNTQETLIENPPKGHLIWAMVDSKTIEKTLPFLNELNLAKITFFYAEFSQKQFKLDLERTARILESSCEQCGRITYLDFELLPNLDSVLQKYTKIAVMDFGAQPLKTHLEIPFLIGPEGGLSQNERTMLENQQKFSLPFNNILRSQTAVIYATSQIR